MVFFLMQVWNIFAWNFFNIRRQKPSSILVAYKSNNDYAETYARQSMLGLGG